MMQDNYPQITDENVFKYVMCQGNNCLGLLKITLEELNLQSADVIPGRRGASNLDYDWNQLNVVARDGDGNAAKCI